MEKKLCGILLAVSVCVAMLVTGCSSDSDKGEINNDITLDEAIDKTKDISLDATIAPYESGGNESQGNQNDDDASGDFEYPDEDAALSSALFDFSFELEGDNITLPLTLEEFRSLGWESRLDLVDTISAGGSSVAGFVRLGKEITISLANISEAELPINECLVYSVCSDRDSDNPALIKMPKGIVMGVSNENDVLNAFGGPHNYNIDYDEEENISYIQYRKDSYQTVDFFMDKENDNTVIGIWISNLPK